MTIDDYLAALDSKLQEIASLVVKSSIQREIDTNTGLGFIKGQITFIDGSRFEFVEQLPTVRTKFRLHHMDSANNLIARWDSAPHHKELNTFPFHKHTPQGVEAHSSTTTVEILDVITKTLKV